MTVSFATQRAIEYVLGKSLSSDRNARYICGHSVGEYTALCAAGALTLESAIKLLKVRSKAVQDASLKCQGGMVALLDAEINEVEDILKSAQIDRICEIANDNGGGQIVVRSQCKYL